MDLCSIEEGYTDMAGHAVSITHQGKQASPWIGFEDGLEEHSFLITMMPPGKKSKGALEVGYGGYGHAVGRVNVGADTRKQGVKQNFPPAESGGGGEFDMENYRPNNNQWGLHEDALVDS